MSTVVILLLVVIGFFLLIFNRKISKILFEIQRPMYKRLFGSFIDLERPWFQKLYRFAVIFAGVIFLLIAYASYFGPITL